jgi:hypothetical protein
MFWLLKLLIDDTERSNVGGGCRVDDSGGDIWKSSKLPAQEYGGGIIVLACKEKIRYCHVLLQHIVYFYPQVECLYSYAIVLGSHESIEVIKWTDCSHQNTPMGYSRMHSVTMCPKGSDVELGANNSAATCARESVTDRPRAEWQ